MNESVFQVSDVTFSYNNVEAIAGLSLSVARGKRVAFLGANGSGKSTLLRLLDGLCFPDSGSVSAFGRTLSNDSLQDREFNFEFRRRVGLVFQDPDVQLFNATVFDEIAFGPLQLGWEDSRIRREVKSAMELMEITHLKDRAPHRLSGGEKKRVALASVLVLDPEVLLLDEPTASLDPKSQGKVIDFLIDWADGKKTVITATHDLDIIEDIADECFIFQNGRMAAESKPGDILKDQALLSRTSLIHAHRHLHESGTEHSHPHTHHRHQHQRREEHD